MSSYTILAIDDQKINLQLIKDILEPEFTVLSALSGDFGIKFATKKKPDLILLDLAMPDKDGKETFKELKENSECSEIPVIFLTADTNETTEAECLDMGAADFITKPIVPKVLKTRIEKTLELEEYHKNLQKKIDEKTLELENVVLQSIATIANTIDAKDEDTIGHSERVADYSRQIAVRMGFDSKTVDNIYRTALLHDVGKIGVPDDVLKKNGRLTDDEYRQIKEHTNIGAKILGNITSIDNIADGAKFHHERYDGKGYPNNLKGEDIPVIGRIIAVADVYDALMSRRCYKAEMKQEDVVSELIKGGGTQFDPEIVSLFVEILKEKQTDNDS